IRDRNVTGVQNCALPIFITCEDAMKIRAEDGRSIEKVNIEPFINNLPGKKDTTQFSTENASGSTSQAANVMEALESQTSLLLIRSEERPVGKERLYGLEE